MVNHFPLISPECSPSAPFITLYTLHPLPPCWQVAYKGIKMWQAENQAAQEKVPSLSLSLSNIYIYASRCGSQRSIHTTPAIAGLRLSDRSMKYVTPLTPPAIRG